MDFFIKIAGICRLIPVEWGAKRVYRLYLVAGEKRLVKEALKSAEYHDSLDTVINEALRIADLIGNAKHYLAFTGAGISTSAGIGDYKGKSGSWTEEDI